MAETSTALAITSVDQIMSANIGSAFCTLDMENADRKTKAQIANALNNPDHTVKSMVNKTIKVKNFLIEVAEILNDDTGEIDRVPRIILFDEKNETYLAHSIGMFNAIRSACRTFGNAPWDDPLNFEICEKPTKNGFMLTAKIS